MLENNTYNWHKLLWPCFPSQKYREWLFRVEPADDNFTILLQSPIKPQIQTWGSWQIKEFGKQHIGLNSYLFKVKFSPCVKKAAFDESGKRKDQGHRSFLSDPEEIKKKLHSIAEGRGFKILEIGDISSPETDWAFKDDTPIPVPVVDVNGALEVTDVDLFNQTVASGIGPHKCFGCGLLLLINTQTIKQF
jgi:CRISPR-associated protein Cas6/Cse3/CasE subtype I-E